MSLAPMVLFTFNRLDHTKKTIDALKENILLKNLSYLYLVMVQEIVKNTLK